MFGRDTFVLELWQPASVLEKPIRLAQGKTTEVKRAVTNESHYDYLLSPTPFILGLNGLSCPTRNAALVELTGRIGG